MSVHVYKTNKHSVLSRGRYPLAFSENRNFAFFPNLWQMQRVKAINLLKQSLCDLNLPLCNI